MVWYGIIGRKWWVMRELEKNLQQLSQRQMEQGRIHFYKYFLAVSPIRLPM